MNKLPNSEKAITVCESVVWQAGFGEFEAQIAPFKEALDHIYANSNVTAEEIARDLVYS